MKPFGLSEKEALEKLEKYGYNEIKEASKISIPRILLRQVKNNFIVYLLLFSTIISFLVGKHETAFTIMAVITIVIITGFIQEYKAERSIKALRNMLVPVSIVIRDGKEREIPTRNVVPGDIIILRNGEKIPADCIVLDDKELRVNESVLTGESKEVAKTSASDTKNTSKENMLFMGTFITNGRCTAQVTHTGMNTEFGKIANLISTAEKELPLQKKVNYIAKYMATVAIIVSLLTGTVMLVRGSPLSIELLVDVLIVVIALSVSAFPESLPVVLTTALASGAYTMAKRNAIVNRLSTIETLGETTVICSDKTGTITTGEMTIKKIFANNSIIDVTGSGYKASGHFLVGNDTIDIKKSDSLKLLMKSAVLCNDSKIERTGRDSEYKLIGTPTEGALLIMAAKAGIFRDDIDSVRIEEIPFNSQRKIMSVLCKEENQVVYVKGAPEILIKKCKYIQQENRQIELDHIQKDIIMSTNKDFTNKSFRTLAIAYKKTDSNDKNTFEENLTLLGIVAMEDPPREEIKQSLALCRSAGIKVKMITGDNKETALSIANEIGLYGNILEGDDLDKLTDDELSKTVNDIVIFARVRPEHKIRIVRSLKDNKEIVTMTGDGVNDAPALKEAHIGVAMGKNGTDVSREVSDLVLKDDNFSTIVTAVAEGRTIFTNIRKFVTYQLSCNYAELLIIFLGILLGLPLPLLALQILFMNMITDDFPAITLGFNPRSRDVMNTEPRRNSNILNKNFFILLAITGTIMGIGTLGVFTYVLKVQSQHIDVARTTALVTLIFFELFNAFNFRSFRHTNYQIPITSNKYLIYASIISIIATIFIIYGPLQKTFGNAPISFGYWILAIAVASSIIFILDILKTINNKKKFLNFD